MLRYFVAVSLPDHSKDSLLAVQPSSVPGLRLIDRYELHLTLHFLGELTSEAEESVRKALENVRMDAFEITVTGIGTFSVERQAMVLWAGVEAGPELLALHIAVGTALSEAIGFRLEERPYSPHITLARWNEPRLPDFIDQWLNENKEFRIPPIPLKHFALYSSTRVGEVPQYKEEAVFDLR